MARMTSELIRIAATGGGMIISAQGKMTSELIQIAAAASKGSGTILIKNLDTRMTSELIQIGAAGKGNVVLDLT